MPDASVSTGVVLWTLAPGAGELATVQRTRAFATGSPNKSVTFALRTKFEPANPVCDASAANSYSNFAGRANLK